MHAAGVGNGNLALALAHGGKAIEQTQITTFRTPKDLLSEVQEHLDLNEDAGAQVEIISHDEGLLGNHSIDRFQDLGPRCPVQGAP